MHHRLGSFLLPVVVWFHNDFSQIYHKTLFKDERQQDCSYKQLDNFYKTLVVEMSP